MGPDRTDTGGDRNTGKIGGGKGYLSCCFLFFTLFISSSRSSSVLIIYSTTTGRAGWVRAGQDVMGLTWAGTATRDSNEGQDRGEAGGWEEEGDGWTGVLRGGSWGSRGRGGRRNGARNLTGARRQCGGQG